jgi:hypothetical protein
VLTHGHIEAHDRVGVLGGELRIVRRGLTRRRIYVGAEKNALRLLIVRWRAPDAAGRRAVRVGGAPPIVHHGYRRIELLRFFTDIVFPKDRARLRIEGHHKAPSRAAGVGLGARVQLLQRAAADDDFSVRENRRAKRQVVRMRIRKRRGAHVQLPALRAGPGIEAVNPAARVREVDRAIGHERRTHDSAIANGAA